MFFSINDNAKRKILKQVQDDITVVQDDITVVQGDITVVQGDIRYFIMPDDFVPKIGASYGSF